MGVYVSVKRWRECVGAWAEGEKGGILALGIGTRFCHPFLMTYNSAITGTIRLYFKTSPCSRFKEFD